MKRIQQLPERRTELTLLDLMLLLNEVRCKIQKDDEGRFAAIGWSASRNRTPLRPMSSASWQNAN
jgi:hypothetical protein